MKLTTNFYLSELEASNKAKQLGIDNTMPQHQGLPSYSSRYLGKISRPTGETTAELVEVEVPVYEELPHYHANLLVCSCCMQDTIDAVPEVIIEQPNNPAEVFA